jgi:hypothetical protein
MKYLESYKLFESNDVDILENIEDIFMDMSDDGVEVNISTSDKTRMHFITKPSIKSDIIEIVLVGKFKPIDYIESFDHLDSYLESEGYRYFADGTYHHTYNARRESFCEGRLLSLLQIKYIKEL